MAWIYHLYRWKKLSAEETAGVLESIPLHYQESENAVDDLYYARKGVWPEFTWQSWVFPEAVIAGEFGISDPREWLTFGFLAEQIRRYQLPFFESGLQLERQPELSFIIAELKNDAAYFKTHMEEWKLILSVADQDDLTKKKDAVIGFFERLATEQEGAELEKYATAGIEPPAIEAFGEQAKDRWYKQSGVFTLFNDTDTTDQPPPSQFIGIEQFVRSVKRFFVDYTEPSDLYFLGDIGSQAGRQVDEAFFDVVLQHASVSLTGNFTSVVSQAIARLKSNQIEPDVIFVSATRLYLEQEFLDDERYVEKAYDPEDESVPELKGWFDEIPVYTSFASALTGLVIVASFATAFKANFGEQINIDNYSPQTTITPLTEVEATNIARGQQNGPEPPRRKVLELLNGVALKVGVAASFEVKDANAAVKGILNA